MKSDRAGRENLEAGADADPANTADLRLRLQASQEQLRAARAEARCLARELSLARRLLRFATGALPPPARPIRLAEIPRQRATLLTDVVLYHIDSCKHEGTHTTITGWAFRPAPDWDARAATVTLLFRHGAMAYTAVGSRVSRPDVAAHFAGQPQGTTGGARGLDGAGFTCEVLHDSLPAGMEFAVVLRLEYAGRACEQSTAQRLRL